MTKQMLAEYFVAVAESILPHIAGRPLSVVRCPEGSGKPCFFQKPLDSDFPKVLTASEFRIERPASKNSF